MPDIKLIKSFHCAAIQWTGSNREDIVEFARRRQHGGRIIDDVDFSVMGNNVEGWFTLVYIVPNREELNRRWTIKKDEYMVCELSGWRAGEIRVLDKVSVMAEYDFATDLLECNHHEKV